MPTEQISHSGEPLFAAANPKGHCVQLVCLACPEACCPSKHSPQSFCCFEFVNLPASQSSQRPILTFSACIPLAQAVHVSSPAVGANIPTIQSSHTTLPGPDVIAPMTQSGQVPFPLDP